MSLYDVLAALRERGPMTAREIERFTSRGSRTHRLGPDIRRLARRGLIEPAETRRGHFGHPSIVWRLT